MTTRIQIQICLSNGEPLVKKLRTLDSYSKASDQVWPLLSMTTYATILNVYPWNYPWQEAVGIQLNIYSLNYWVCYWLQDQRKQMDMLILNYSCISRINFTCLWCIFLRWYWMLLANVLFIILYLHFKVLLLSIYILTLYMLH